MLVGFPAGYIFYDTSRRLPAGYENVADKIVYGIWLPNSLIF
jgi:hypothetical protein